MSFSDREEKILDILRRQGSAGAIGVSPDYAGRIFRRECGRTLTEHILRTRVSLLRILISSNRSVPLSDLVAQAGFTDLRYARRIFKRKTGCTMQRCRQLDSGITLLHEDPWKSPNLDQDIYQGSALDPIVKVSFCVG